ncbi:HIT family protein [Streptomyces sp. NPDC101165]|uniref:HIT family protein n=1 Tax=Streptomyces sp. NPDC101165 TaxID=3366119 RepID=UPI0038272AD3
MRVLRHRGGTTPLVLFEDERTVAFLDNTAVMEGHTLVIPKHHAADIWAVSEDDAAAVMRTVHRMAGVLQGVLEADGMTLFQANRPAGWQDVFHLHVHLVLRRDADHLHAPGTWTAPIRPRWRGPAAASSGRRERGPPRPR